MKFIKVTALAAAMMTTFGAQAELTAMDDAALEAVTGQTGISIELDIADIDVAWSDGDGNTATTAVASQGNLLIQNLSLSGTVTVDVDATDGLVIGFANQFIQTNVGLTSGAVTSTNISTDLTQTQTLGQLSANIASGSVNITAK